MRGTHIVLTVLVAAALAGMAWMASHHGGQARQVILAPVQSHSAHYTLYSYASQAQSRRVLQAAEALHAAYGRVFQDAVEAGAPAPRLQMVLYATRAQFKAHNRSSPWAEAFYQYPRCHAYYDPRAANPTHWMVHEATHQLIREWAHQQPPKWLDEGVATYFGTSRLRGGILQAGNIDPATYPAWWLPQLWLSGDLRQDLAEGRLIPLRALITGTGPDIDRNVNLYYLEYWTLAHFLLDGDGGRHAAGFKALLQTRGSIADFERLLGPVGALQQGWYAHLLQMRRALLRESTK